jgi:Domain of unknown function (DUF4258)
MRSSQRSLTSFWTLVILAGLTLNACHSAPSQQDLLPVKHIQPPAAVTVNPDPFDRHAKLKFTKHARCRMDCRHITTHEIEEILDSGSINYQKSQPAAHPDPKYAVEGYTDQHQHLRLIVAPSHKYLIVITCMELGVEWQCHCN